jgi:hypothetical protein
VPRGCPTKLSLGVGVLGVLPHISKKQISKKKIKKQHIDKIYIVIEIIYKLFFMRFQRVCTLFTKKHFKTSLNFIKGFFNKQLSTY